MTRFRSHADKGRLVTLRTINSSWPWSIQEKEALWRSALDHCVRKADWTLIADAVNGAGKILAEMGPKKTANVSSFVRHLLGLCVWLSAHQGSLADPRRLNRTAERNGTRSSASNTLLDAPRSGTTPPPQSLASIPRTTFPSNKEHTPCDRPHPARSRPRPRRRY